MLIKGDDGFSGIPVPAPGTFGVLGDSAAGYGVVGISGGPAGVYGESKLAVSGDPPPPLAPGVHGVNRVGIGVMGEGFRGVFGSGTVGVAGLSGTGSGVIGDSSSGVGVIGRSISGTGVLGRSDSATAASAVSSTGLGLLAESGGWAAAQTLNTGIGFPGNLVLLSTPDWAGFFDGDVAVVGNLHKLGGGFLIDHPLDPANRYLEHSFVESPDRKNLYDGIAVLDSQGEAQVELPAWFGVLNRDFRYQLTCLGEAAPVFIAAEIQGDRFRIAGGRPGTKVSWQVTGIRQDAWANANPLVPDSEKPVAERGSYLQPALFEQPAARSLRRTLVPEQPAPSDLPQGDGDRR